MAMMAKMMTDIPKLFRGAKMRLGMGIGMDGVEMYYFMINAIGWLG